MALDVKQAQEVQQVILPEEHTSFLDLKWKANIGLRWRLAGTFFR